MNVETGNPHDLEKLSPLIQTKENGDNGVKEEKKYKILLEPVLIGSMMAINLGQTSLQNFYLRTACSVDLKFPLEVCDSGEAEDFRSIEAASQAYVSHINVSRSFVGSLISTVVLLFMGPWSDCSGRRKPILILPLIGMSVMTTGVLLMLVFPGATTVQVLYAVQIPISMGGSFGLLLAGVFSHLGDICHSTGRDVTRTMGSHRAAMQVAHVLGAISGPLLYRHLGFYGVFPTVLSLQIASLLYVIMFVEDVNVNTDNKISVFNAKLPLDALNGLIKRRQGYKRAIILFMVFIALGDKIFLSSEVLIAYMYYRYKFNWSDVLFGSFLAYKNCVSFIGTLVILAILKKRFKMSDETVGMMSCISFIMASFGLIAASTTVVVFLTPFIGLISQGSQVVQRPLLNKQIAPSEQGKVYSAMIALEAATQTLTSPLYSLLYSKTVKTAPDAWLLPGIGLALLQLISYLSSDKLGKKTDYRQNDPSSSKQNHSVQI